MQPGHNIESVLYSAGEISERVKELGKLITEAYSGKELILICPLKGSVIFFADLMREIKIPVEIDFMSVSSYNSSTISSGEVKILKDISTGIAEKHVLIIEDIIDTGLTLKEVKGIIEKRKPASLKICTLLNKPSRRIADIEPDWSGFVIPDKFVVGYGLDYGEKFRNLPYIGVLKTSNT